MKTLSFKLIVTPYHGGMASVTFSDRRPNDICMEPENPECQVGDIYIGRVQNVVKNIRGAFLDLGNGITGYYPLDQKTTPIYTKKGASPNIQQGDELLVQIKKDAVKTKALALSAELSVSGRYLVAVIGSSRIAVSSKLRADGDASFWSRLLADNDESSESSVGWIVRTNAQNASEEQILREARYLREYCRHLTEIAVHRVCGTCMHHSGGEYLDLIKGSPAGELEEILTDSKEAYEAIQTYLTHFQPEDQDKLKFYEDRLQPLYKKYPVETAVDEALRERIWLKSGGYLVIQMTEALTSIDVNTGKYDGKKQTEETFLKINLEAAREAARQMRLRNLAGIIIIDFINMKKEENREYLLAEMRKYLKTDTVQSILVDMTPLGLVEITRKRTRKTVAEQMQELERSLKKASKNTEKNIDNDKELC